MTPGLNPLQYCVLSYDVSKCGEIYSAVHSGGINDINLTFTATKFKPISLTLSSQVTFSCFHPSTTDVNGKKICCSGYFY